MNMQSNYHCQACRASHLSEIEGFPQLPRVTSDSKPFRSGGRLFVCSNCGMVQKIPDPAWLEEIGEIYGSYEMYHQSASNDQTVFDPVSGRPSGRCEILAQRLLESGCIPASGTLLDVGAGSGAMLGAFSAACNDWRLFGLDLDDRKEQSLKAIPRFEELFTVPPEQLSKKFELLTLIHSLEHFPDPVAMLKKLRGLIAPGGKLFIQVNNAAITPFDLVVADHMSHFTPASLAYLVSRAGLGVEQLHTDWINKEISLLVSMEATPSSNIEDAQHANARTQHDVQWLASMLDRARELSAHGSFAVFGTSVAATWLAADLGESISFFVDEDPARKDRTHLGRPILTPNNAPAGSVIYLAFVSTIAAGIKHRLAHLPLQLEAP